MSDANLNSIDGADERTSKTLRVVIVGGGFGGLAAAKALGKAPVQVILIDRTNHHVFQPLLYQVATSVLSPSQISSPIRGILRRRKNTTVIMGEVTGVDKEQRCVFVNSPDREHVPVHYDYLILATGVRHRYFGHNEFEKFAPGLKSLDDAVAIRNKVLQAFEQAEAEEDPKLHPDLLTFVLVGAGPTGVEMAAALAVLVRTTLRSDFRRIDPTKARIALIDAAPKVLGTFAPDLSAEAQKHLEKLGVDPAQFHEYFPADLPNEVAAFMARSQVLNFADNFNAVITTPAWRSKPTWMLVPTKDRTINPDLERWYATRAKSHTVEVSGASHAVYVSRPKEVAAVIEEAASHVR